MTPAHEMTVAFVDGPFAGQRFTVTVQVENRMQVCITAGRYEKQFQLVPVVDA